MPSRICKECGETLSQDQFLRGTGGQTLQPCRACRGHCRWCKARYEPQPGKLRECPPCQKKRAEVRTRIKSEEAPWKSQAMSQYMGERLRSPFTQPFGAAAEWSIDKNDREAPAPPVRPAGGVR